PAERCYYNKLHFACQALFSKVFDSRSALLSSNFGRIPYHLLFVNHFFRGFSTSFSAARRALTSATALLEYQSHFQKSTLFSPICTFFRSSPLFFAFFPLFAFLR
ncbi:hypothetical protein, partial [Oscillibacter sp.]|uniref:hypothetical protein n=1 Tax=Oscillibacter sp. TaxID=1945593 RepID=UPI001B643888